MNSDLKIRQYLVFVLLLVVSSLLAIFGYRGLHQDLIISKKGAQPFTKSPSSAESIRQDNNPPQKLKPAVPVITPQTQSSAVVVKNQTRNDEHPKKANSVSGPISHEDKNSNLEQQPIIKDDDATKLQRAEMSMVRKEYGQAEAIYREYLERHGDDLKVRLKLAEILSWEKKYDASLAEYERILKARPDDKQVRRKYANVLIWSGKIDEAASELRKTME